MKRRLALKLIGGSSPLFLLLATGCSDTGDSSSHGTIISSAQLSELESALEGLGSQIDDLETHVQSFRDGSTNWRDIVPDVELTVEEVKAAFDEAEATLQKLK